MIAASNDPGACASGENCPEGNFVAMFTECCDLRNDGNEICSSWEGELFFPRRNCDFIGIALGKIGRIDNSILSRLFLFKSQHSLFTLLFSIQRCQPVGMGRSIP